MSKSAECQDRKGRPQGRRTVAASAFLAVSLAIGCGGGNGSDTSSADPLEGTTSQGIFYRVSGSGPSVVLIHAFSMDSRMWDMQVEALESRFRVIRYDQRSHGRSAAVEGAYQHQEDLRGVLDQVDAGQAWLVGLSSGARIAVDFALTYPERVAGLLLASPGLSGYVPQEPMDWFQPVIDAVRGGDAQRAAQAWAETPIMKVYGTEGSVRKAQTLVLENSGLWALQANPEKPLDPPATKRLEEIACPLLVLVGEKDLPETSHVAELLSTVEGMRTMVLPGAGHLLNLDDPEVFNRRMLEFLRQM